MSMLDANQQQTYAHDGFVAPCEAMSAQQASHYRSLLEDFERGLGAPLSAGEARFRFELEPRPDGPGAETAHALNYRRYREGYNEQIEWHSSGRGWQACGE